MKKFENVNNRWDPSRGDYQIDYESTRTYAKKKRRKKIIRFVVIALFVLAVLVGGYFFTKSYFLSSGRV